MNENTYKVRRDALLQKMDEGIAVLASAPQAVRSNDTEFPYRPDSDFYYLTGFREDNAALVLIKRADEAKTYLFVQPKDEKMELWTGKRMGAEAAKERFDVDDVFGIDTFDEKIKELMPNLPSLYLDLFSDETCYASVRKTADRLRHERGTKRPVTKIEDVRYLVRTLRLIKSSEEIGLMRDGLKITDAAHHHAMNVCADGMMEYALQAEYEYIFKKHGAFSDAYATIVAGGNNANTLHYISNDCTLNAGDLVLIDAGCEYGFYATDITRTFPVCGRFTPAQKAVYEMVLGVQQAVIERIRPGTTKSGLQTEAERLLCEGMVSLGVLAGDVDKLIEEKAHKRYFPHGIGHWIGMDVHDPLPYYDEKGEEIPLQPGMVMTIEPGIYLPEDDTNVPEEYRGIGIRIEDDILITETGYENLSIGIAKSVEAIEALMGS